jgi:hypothetical protein
VRAPQRMDRPTIPAHLAQAERQVAEGDRYIQRQRKLIADLHRNGHVTRDVRTMLGHFEELQDLHIAHRDLMRKEFDARMAAS